MEKSDYESEQLMQNVTNVPADVKVIFVLVSFPVSGFCVFPILEAYV